MGKHLLKIQFIITELSLIEMANGSKSAELRTESDMDGQESSTKMVHLLNAKESGTTLTVGFSKGTKMDPCSFQFFKMMSS